MKTLFSTIAALARTILLPACAAAQIEVYFNHSIDSTLAYPPGNIARGGIDLSDIAIGEILRARHSIDMAMYNLNLESLAHALIAAHNRGVRIRVIGDADNIGNPNSRFGQLSRQSIPVASNPPAASGQIQPLMHHKFILIDARPGAPPDAGPTIITGSWNATSTGTYADPNNLLILRDSAVAGAYLREFQEMWGGEGEHPNPANARFGATKQDDTDHEFILHDGTPVKLFFSPSDRTSREIGSTLAHARHSILMAQLTMTYTTFTTALRRRAEQGVDIRAIIGNVQDQGSQFPALVLFADAIQWHQRGLLHHKYAIIDPPPLAAAASPVVITGSHNWSVSAEIRNDENTLIITSPTVANLFLQEFSARYRESGGSRPFISVSGISNGSKGEPIPLRAYPNPFKESVHLTVDLDSGGPGEIVIRNSMGSELARFTVGVGTSTVQWQRREQANGIYFATLHQGGRIYYRKLSLIH